MMNVNGSCALHELNKQFN